MTVLALIGSRANKLEQKVKLYYRLLDSLVVECWHRVREVPGSIRSQGLRHTKDVIKMVPGSSLV